MSFNNFFGGFCVIHAPFVCAERKPYFENELQRIGIDKFHIIEARPVLDSDFRLLKYRPKSNGVLSLIDAAKSCIEFAKKEKWDSLVIFEDDIIFRKNFSKLWEQIENEAKESKFSIMSLHRRGADNRLITVEKFFQRNKILPLIHNMGTQCVIVKRESYDKLLEALDICIEKGWPYDFFYGVSGSLGCKLVATSKNLAGQRGGIKSTLQGSSVRNNFYSSFFSCRTFIEYIPLWIYYSIKNKLRK